MKITAFVPCRKGSQRIENKNVKSFSNSSLLHIKLEQLIKCKNIDNIVVSTDDEEVIEIAKSYRNDKITIHERDDYFASSVCSTEELISYIINNIEFEHLLWTHVTSPFCDEKIYDEAVDIYKGLESEYDSFVSAEKIQEFLWDKNGNGVNYDKVKDGRWPQTQTLEPLYLVNSAIFLASKKVMLENNDRVGKAPYFYCMNKLHSIDIDWPEDFEAAQMIYNSLRGDND